MWGHPQPRSGEGVWRHHPQAGGALRPQLRRAVLRLAVVVSILTGLAAGLTLPTAAPRAAAGEPGATPFVQIRIDQVTPQTVTTTSDPVVTVAGTVTNVGDRPVRDVVIRLEHAPAVSASATLRTDLDGNTDQYQPVADFQTLSPTLQRGHQVGFTLSAPVRSLTKPSLGIGTHATSATSTSSSDNSPPEQRIK